MSNNQKPYLPNERSWYEAPEGSLISKSPEGIDTILASPVEDAIVVNNISYMEFDYTENPFSDTPIEDDPE